MNHSMCHFFGIRTSTIIVEPPSLALSSGGSRVRSSPGGFLSGSSLDGSWAGALPLPLSWGGFWEGSSSDGSYAGAFPLPLSWAELWAGALPLHFGELCPGESLRVGFSSRIGFRADALPVSLSVEELWDSNAVRFSLRAGALLLLLDLK